jgi:hypothetical protein
MILINLFHLFVFNHRQIILIHYQILGSITFELFWDGLESICYHNGYESHIIKYKFNLNSFYILQFLFQFYCIWFREIWPIFLIVTYHHIEFITDLGSCFHGLPSLFVRKGSTVTYAVHFKGTHEGRTEGSLILKNNKDAEDSFQYRYRTNIFLFFSIFWSEIFYVRTIGITVRLH